MLSVFYIEKYAGKVEKMLKNIFRTNLIDLSQTDEIKIEDANKHEIMCLSNIDCREIGNGTVGYDPTGEYVIISERISGDLWSPGHTIPKFAVRYDKFIQRIENDIKIEDDNRLYVKCKSGGTTYWAQFLGECEFIHSVSEHYDVLDEKYVINHLSLFCGANSAKLR